MSTLLLSVRDSVYNPFPEDAAFTARAEEVQRIAAKVSALPPRTYYVALNVNNNADIMPQLHDQLLVLVDALGASNVFASIWRTEHRRHP